MKNSNCIYCYKNLTNKGFKKHILICKFKNIPTKTLDILENNNNLINKNNYFNIIPDDCLHIIFHFYIPNDPFISSKIFNLYLFNIAITCKRLYNIFKPPIGLKYIYNKEIKNKMMETDVITQFHLSESDLMNIKFERLDNKNNKIKFYKKIDILDICFQKYGNYNNFLHIIGKNKNKNYKDSFYILQKKRENKYNLLFKKYNISNKDIYNKFKNYIYYGFPKLNFIENVLNKEKTFILH